MNTNIDCTNDTENSNDYFATEILGELKRENERKEMVIKSLIKVVVGVIIVALIGVAGVVGGFLWYLNQYDFSSTSSSYKDANGVYAIIDSEGNVISSDLTKEELEMIMHGYIESTQSYNEAQD